MSKLIASIIIGIFLGVLCARFLFVNSAIALIPWGIVGIVLGWWSKTRKNAFVNGCIYGFSLAFSFMFSVYEGSAPIISRIPFFTIMGLVGALCGLTLALLGYYGRKKMIRKVS